MHTAGWFEQRKVKSIATLVVYLRRRTWLSMEKSKYLILRIQNLA